jgi:hypothetical protein
VQFADKDAAIRAAQVVCVREESLRRVRRREQGNSCDRVKEELKVTCGYFVLACVLCLRA